MGSGNENMADFRNIAIQEERLRDGVRNFDSQTKSRILDALETAKNAHEGQKRDEGDPYVIHPIRIANTLIHDLNVSGAEIIVAGSPHDVVEDADCFPKKLLKTGQPAWRPTR